MGIFGDDACDPSAAAEVDPLAVLRATPTVSVAVTAQLLGVSPESVYRWAREGSLPGVIRLGARTVRVRSADLLAEIEGDRR